DIAGDALQSYLISNPLPPKAAAKYLNQQFELFLSNTSDKLDGLFGSLLGQYPKLKIFCHGYDWPFARDGGLWLRPAMLAQAVPQTVQAAVLKLMIDRYYEMLGRLADKYRDCVFVADCRGSVGPVREWFDELHPLNAGYARAAERFRRAINRVFDVSRLTKSLGTAAVISWYPKKGAKALPGRAEFAPGSVVTVGRRSDIGVIIDDESVSRNHVRLEIRQGSIVFTDLNTTNGTFLDGRRRIGATLWQPGQKLSVGNHLLELQFARSAAHKVSSAGDASMPTTIPLQVAKAKDGAPAVAGSSRQSRFSS